MQVGANHLTFNYGAFAAIKINAVTQPAGEQRSPQEKHQRHTYPPTEAIAHQGKATSPEGN
ncbi:hypothetical protein SOASR030_22300 [Leminorella grimontii]|uniref:Uncharacterized protein n=1 Tax=Leminorella grimontii TaxID=82981 RepID=A0AAV5N3P0_9GAMM|nr:hypothetical protein SOASR030_22300 [Leminorella grimontii]